VTVVDAIDRLEEAFEQTRLAPDDGLEALQEDPEEASSTSTRSRSPAKQGSAVAATVETAPPTTEEHQATVEPGVQTPPENLASQLLTTPEATRTTAKENIPGDPLEDPDITPRPPLHSIAEGSSSTIVPYDQAKEAEPEETPRAPPEREMSRTRANIMRWIHR
jgi:hypothetical protein